MKAEILKIAGVKSEKEFYKKYPTEEAFMKAHSKEFRKAKIGKAVPKAQNAYLDFMKDKPNCKGKSWKPGCGGNKGGGDEGMNTSNAPVTSKELTASGYTMADKKKIKQRAKDLQTDFPGISADDVAMAMGDSARVQAKFPNLPIIDKNIVKYNELKGQSLNEAHRYLPYSDYFFNFYRPYITTDAQGKPNPLTVPEILSTQESPQAYRDRVNKNYKQRKGGETKKLQQLTDFGNPPKYQVSGPPISLGLNAPAGGSMLNPNLQTTTDVWGTGGDINTQPELGGITPKQVGAKDFVGKSKVDVLGKLGGAEGVGQLVGGIAQGIQKEKNWKKQKNQAILNNRISDITLRAANSTPEQIKRRYVRPEDAFVQPDEMFPTYGVGTNYLAKDGTTVSQIGGNPTEIQNMYNPGDLYSHLGYEPMSESDIVKQYRHGGVEKAEIGNALSAFSSGLNAAGDTSGIISGIGNVAGKFIPGVGQMAQLAQFAVNRERRKALEKQNKLTQSNFSNAAFKSGTQGMQQGQFNSFMEDGGWVSHDWQPQVIAKFGDYSMQDLLKRNPMMDTLRTGGRITQNNIFPTDQYALGGELKTTWGGYAEPISYNPYMPGTGETVMFRGKSHEEGDGNGHTGIGVKYGDGGMTDYAKFGSKDADADVEVERGEPATEMLDPETGEKNMVVFGNLKIPNMFLDQIGDKKAKGKKFKNYVANLGKDEAKQNKIIEKATEELDALEVYTPFDKLKFDALQATIQGANMKLKEAALKKSNASAVQNAINETAEEQGIDADALAKGKYKIDKEAMKEQAKYGKHIPQAQKGKRNVKGGEPKMETLPNGELKFTHDDGSYYIVHKDKSRTEYDKSGKVTNQVGKSSYDKARHKVTVTPAAPSEVPMEPIENTFNENLYRIPPKKKFDWMPTINQALEYLRPTDQEEFDYSQVYPEMMALSLNQLEPVQAQLYRPDLGTPMDISLQDQMNANQADFNALQRQMGYNPEALSTLAAQKYSANSKVLGDQFRLNQAEKQRVYEGNRALLNDAQLKNLGILDTQMVRQEEAKSRTKQQAIEAMKSVADKIAKNKLENRTLGIYENLYKYRFDPSGRAINMNPLAQFDYSGSGSSSSLSAPEGYEYETILRKKKKDDDTGRNGKIVKAIKNL